MPPLALARIGPRYRPQFDPTAVTVVQAAERQAAASAAAPAAVLGLDAELYPPAGSRGVFQTDQQLVAGAGVIALLPGCAYTVAVGHVLVLRQLTLFADSPTIDTRATWAILANGVPLPGLGTLALLWRAASSLATTFDTLRVVVPEKVRVEVQVTNVDGAARVFGAQLVGWTMPRASLAVGAGVASNG